MEDVAADQHHLRRQLDHLVQRARERLRDIRLALIDPARSQPLILAVAKVDVGEVNEAQTTWVGRC
jgi:selenophosphate synthase